MKAGAIEHLTALMNTVNAQRKRIAELEAKVLKLQTVMRMATISEEEIVRTTVSADQSFEDAETGIALTDDDETRSKVPTKTNRGSNAMYDVESGP